MKRLFLFSIAFFVLSNFACSPATQADMSEPSPVVSTPTPAITEPSATPIPTETPMPFLSFEPQVYRDEAAGFEFEYPVGWAFDGGEGQSRGYYVQFYSWDWKPGDPIEPFPAGGTVLSVTVQLWDPKNDLEAFINQRKIAWDASGISILSEERITLTADQPAAQFIIQGVDGAQAFFLLTTNGEDYLVLSGNGDLDLLAEISQTLRPVQ